MTEFTVGKIHRSLQRFIDFTNDLSTSDMNTFDDRLSVLINFCQNDDVFQFLSNQLLQVESVDFEKWHTQIQSTEGSMFGSGNLSFPVNIDERLSLMYQLLLKIQRGDIDFLNFTTTFFAVGDSRIDSFIYAFNHAITEPLSRELGYRFEELIESFPENQRDSIPISSIQIIHNANTVIQQSANGSNNTQTATIQPDTELHNLFVELKKEINNSSLDKKQLLESLEIAESAEELSSLSEPKVGVVKALLKSLPSLGNIASIVSTILSIITI